MSWLSDHLPRGELVLDASVIINLLGTGEPVELLRGLGQSCLIEQRTLQEIQKHPVPGFNLTPTLNTLLTEGTLQEVRMTDNEYETFIRLIHAPLGVRLGDGESAAIAICARCAGIVLDEKRARRIVAIEAPETVVASSLKLILSSAHRQAWPLARLQESIQMARGHARMGVPKDEVDLLNRVLAAKGA